MRNENAAATVVGALRTPHSALRTSAAFTMIEIAICLAIISFALIAIIGVLPLGMNTQRDVHQETVINQDATVLLEAIRSGARGINDLTNYVTAITITNTITGASLNVSNNYLTTGARIIGLLSTPSVITNVAGFRVVATVRSMSGLAAEKPPQTSGSILFQDTFSYQVVCMNYPVAPAGFAGLKLDGIQHELRMTFLWPQLPNGNLGNGRQTFRATIAGQMNATNDGSQTLYFFQSQTFTNANWP